MIIKANFRQTSRAVKNADLQIEHLKKAWDEKRLDTLQYYEHIYKHFEKGLVVEPKGLHFTTDYKELFESELPDVIQVLSKQFTDKDFVNRSIVEAICRYQFKEQKLSWLHEQTEFDDLWLLPDSSMYLFPIQKYSEEITPSGKIQIAESASGLTFQLTLRDLLFRTYQPQRIEELVFEQAPFTFLSHLRKREQLKEKLAYVKKSILNDFSKMQMGMRPRKNGINNDAKLSVLLNYARQYTLPKLHHLTLRNGQEIENLFILQTHYHVRATEYLPGQYARIYNYEKNVYGLIEQLTERPVKGTFLIDQFGDQHKVEGSYILVKDKTLSHQTNQVIPTRFY